MPTLEWWTTPGEAQHRLDMLENQMNLLRNVALGRGVRPLVGPQLAQRVAAEWEQFRNWREGLGGITFVASWANELEQYTRRANDLRVAISAAGLEVPAALLEFETPGPAFVTGTLGLAVGGLALVWAILRRKK